MPILLPNLDDRRWTDLVNEGRALIPLFAPEWTDQNAHDPGITLIELLAWFAEMDIFQLNRVSDQAKLKFLTLVGIHPEPPRAAGAVLSFSLIKDAPLALPGAVEFSGLDAFGQVTVFQSADPVTVQPVALAAVQLKDGNGFHDLSDQFRRGVPFGAFGDVPQTGTELYLGFNAALETGAPFSLFFTFASSKSKPAERHRILDEARAQRCDCIPVTPMCPGGPSTLNSISTSPCNNASALVNPGVRLTWEQLLPGNPETAWAALTAADDTRAFTLDGGVVVTPAAAGAASKLGQVNTSLFYIRVRFEAGAYDSPPVVRNLAINSVRAKQCAYAGSLTWQIAPGVAASAPPVEPVGLNLAFDTSGEISALSFISDAATPRFTVLSFVPADTAASGSLTIEAVSLGCGDGTPSQQPVLPGAPIEQASLNLFTLENSGWRTWCRRADFDSSRPGDADFLLDPTEGTITFGDGNQGRVVPEGARILATYLTTRADSGNLRAKTALTVNDSPHNRALLPNLQDVSDRLLTINPLPAAGGTVAESLDLAIARAIRMLQQPERAVTLADYELLAIETPGTDIARAKAWADHHPSFPCFEAPGMITVVIVPNMPVAAPLPGRALLNSVAQYLNLRRIIGTRIEVTAPTYRTVAVQAQVQSAGGASKTAVKQRIVDALNAYLDPLTGGPSGDGWPFGRDVYRIEMMQVVDQVPGVDYVTSMALFADGCTCDPLCTSVCLLPTELVAAGSHQIEVL